MRKTIALFAALLLVAFVMPICVSAQETAAGQAAEKKTEDIFNIPDTLTAEELEARLMGIVTYQPEDINSQEEYDAYMKKQADALGKIANLLLKRDDATDEQKDIARSIKLQTIIMGGRDDTAKALADLEAYKKELAEAKSDVLYRAQVMAFQLKLQKPVMAAMMGEEGDHTADVKKVIEEIKVFLGENEFRSEYVMLPQMLLAIAGMLDQDGTNGLQKFVIEELKPALEKSDSEEAKAILNYMEGALRFAKLPGSEMELQAVLLDGKKIDIKNFRDKVVLVDFWATWCGPCQMAIPTMKKLYDQYHEKGFELIAYSCDEDLDDLKAFEAKSPHPWHVASVVLSVEQKLTDYSEFYGIPGYPTFVLVGKDGKVVHVTHDINEIAEKLAELFPTESK